MSARAVTRNFLSRPKLSVVRQGGLRHQSTTQKASETASEATAKAKDTAGNFQSKASQGLSKVTSSAGPALSGAANSVGNALGKIGGRTGRLIGFVQSLYPPTLYYSKVTLELGKLVFQGQKMSLPSAQTFQAYFQPMINVARNPASLVQAAPSASSVTPEAVLSRVRNVDRSQLAFYGVVAAEVLGFFTVGEMLGRWKLIGYRGEVHHEH